MKFTSILLLFIFSVILASCKPAKEGSAPSALPPTSTLPSTNLTISPVTTAITVNGAFTFTATNGVSPYTFSIVSGGGVILTVVDQGQLTAPATAGVVVVRVTDSLGATADASVFVSDVLTISPPTINLSVNGSLTFIASGGAPPITFSILSGAGSINPSTGAYIAPAISGSDVVRVTDSLGNTADSIVTITNALGITPAAVTLAVNNTITFSALGGVAPFVYSIVSGGGSINSATGSFTAPATSGSVVVRVTDSLSATADSVVTVNSALAISPASVSVTVGGVQTFTAVGGVAPFVYSVLSGGGSINSATGIFTAPASTGSVIVRVTDSLSNVSDSTVTIVSLLTIAPVSKTLAANNIFTFTASGGLAPYSYSVFSGSGSINSVTGSYTAPATSGSAVVRATDALGQTAESMVTINGALVISPAAITLAVNNVTTFSATGGVSPYTYSIVSGGGSINATTGVFTAPATSGAVMVRVTDTLLNISDSTVTVNPALVISPSVATLAINGTQIFTGANGVGPYTYSILSGGGSINATTGAFTAPATAGSVVVQVTDSLSNSTNAAVTVSGAVGISPSTVTLAVNNVFTFVASGGSAPYTFSIFSGGGSINSVTGAFTAPNTAGGAVVRVTDSLGQIADAAVAINAAIVISPVAITLAVNNVTTFSATGGVSPYTYSIVSGGGSINSSTGAFTAPATAGAVTVRVTDTLSNISDSTVTVNPALVISPAAITLAVNNVTTFSATGGVSPYTYSIVSGGGSINSSTGAFTAPATAGAVTVRVTDTLSNISDSTVTVNPALAISPAAITLAVNNVTTFSATGGVSPYTYSIVSGGGSINATTGVFTAPATSGAVIVRVTDTLLNTSNGTVTVNPALVISPAAITLAVNNVTTFSATGGVSPYTYSIVSGGGSINATTGVFTAPATAGSVTVRVTDTLSNTSNATVTVNAAVVISPAAVTLAVNGTQTFTATGGVGVKTFSILSGGGSINSSTGAFIAPAISGAVTVRATDTLSNVSDSTVTVNGPLAISPTTLNIVAGDAQTFVAAGGVSPYTYSIVSGSGTIDPVTGDYVAGVAASTDVIRVTDSLANFVNVTVTVYDALTLSPTAVTVAVNGSQTFTATGGLGSRTFSILSGGGSIDSVTGVFTAPATAGTTVVEVQDTIANSITATITLVSSLTISPAALKLPVFSTAQFSAILGSPAYTYSIFSGTGSVVAATGVYTGGPLAGIDTVRVTDAGFNTSDSSVTLIEPVQTVSGSNHNCVRYNEGSVKCWGLNSSGQLGLGDALARGDTANEGGSNLPFVNLGTGRTAKMLAAGYTHTCAILDNDTVKCWGANASGQLGLGDVVTRGNLAGQMGDSLPIVNLGTGRTAKKIAAGNAATCAILDNDTLKCWGINTYGQLGQGSTAIKGNAAGTMGDSLLAVNLGTGRTAKDVSVGLDHTCVILDDNNLKCFGRNDRGQLGKDNITTLGTTAGTMGDALLNINLGAGRTAVAISNGYSFTCVLLDNGTMKCFGRNQSGQLGKDNVTNLGDTAGEMAALTAINLGFTPTKISASRQRACAMNATVVKCWGLNTSGQLLKGNTTTLGDTAGEMAALAAINLGTGIIATDISSAYYGSCVITTNKRIKCFGSAASGYLLNTSTTLHLGDVVGEVGNGLPFVNH